MKQFLHDNGTNGGHLKEGVSEIKSNHIFQITKILDPQGIVEPPKLPLLGDHLIRKSTIEEYRGWISGKKLKQNENDRQSAEDYKSQGQQPEENIFSETFHLAPLSLR
jgi:hypothetical protein